MERLKGKETLGRNHLFTYYLLNSSFPLHFYLSLNVLVHSHVNDSDKAVLSCQ